ncbi:DUF3397 domain-containing protein [Streptococcus agalactiae]|uniref:DUF3397 domain-containing protein n=1 Tax=Streptococcus agalactiae TaxID=1311 RepID=UPI003D7D48D9
MIYKIIASLFLVLIPIFSQVLVKIFKLKKFNIMFPDIAFPIFVFLIPLISSSLLKQNLLPYYLILISLLAIGITIKLLRTKTFFSYKRFLKLFWRSGFILTFLFYLGLLVIIFIKVQ